MLTNPGLESGDTGIVRSGLAVISDAEARSGTYSGLLQSRQNALGPDGVSQIEWNAIAVDPGLTLTWSYYYNGDGATSSDESELVAEVAYASDPTGWTEIDRITIPTKGTGWTLRGPFSLNSSNGVLRVRLRSTNEDETGSAVFWDRWYVDDLVVAQGDVGTEMAIRKHAAMTNLRAQFLKIQGPTSGFRTQLGDRVYDVLILPEDSPEIARPYLCMPLLTEEQDYVIEEKSVLSSWRVRVHLFVDETQPSPTETTAAQSLADAHDDLIKTILEDYTLGGECADLNIISSNSFCGAMTGDRYGELVLDLQLVQRFQRSDLGVTT